LCQTTLRKYADNGQIKHIRTPSGQRRFDVSDFLKVEPSSTTVCYARVSTTKQSNDLDTQRECLAKHYPGCEIISDIGSGLNFKRKGLNSILERALQGECITVVCTYRDRIARFGFDLIDTIIKRNGGTIVVLNKYKIILRKMNLDEILKETPQENGDTQILESFVKDLLENSVSLDPEINELIDQNFWDLIYEFNCR
jgi:predicted site-specific integrase-resolvase